MPFALMSRNFAPLRLLDSKWSQNSISKIFLNSIAISLGAKQICMSEIVLHLAAPFPTSYEKLCSNDCANQHTKLNVYKNINNTLRLVHN